MSRKEISKKSAKPESSHQGLPQKGAKGTEIEGVNTPRQLFEFFFKLEHPSCVDCLGGTGLYAVVRRCRHAHKKGEHYNWYRHIVFEQFNTLAGAREDVKRPCRDLKDRLSEMGADCDEEKHEILFAVLQNGKWRCRHLGEET